MSMYDLFLACKSGYSKCLNGVRVKLKTFNGKYIEDTEDEVNKWLELNDVTIVSLTVADGGLTICILYKDKI